MSKLFVVLACLTLAVAFASAEPAPRFAKLQTKLSCSLTDVYECGGEIEGKSIGMIWKTKSLSKLLCFSRSITKKEILKNIFNIDKLIDFISFITQ